jgi:putative SOS response-associated peptidase YedK
MTTAGPYLAHREHGRPLQRAGVPSHWRGQTALTIQIIAMRTASRVGILAKRGEL